MIRLCFLFGVYNVLNVSCDHSSLPPNFIVLFSLSEGHV